MPKPAAKKVLAAYVPVLHRGYLQFFKHRGNIKEIYIIGPDLLKKVDYLRKDLRALAPAETAAILTGSKLFSQVSILTAANLRGLDQENTQVVMPDEDISREVGKLFKKAKVDYFPVFLRWDRRSLESVSRVDPDDKISQRQLDKQRMAQAYEIAKTSTDIWRRVGAVLINKKGIEIDRATNQAEPSSHSPWMEGDPRNIFNQGVDTDLAVFMHAEAAVIATAAKRGVNLTGASLYVTTYSCPWCAKLIAYSGISNLYYTEGYGSLDAKRVLTDHGVKLRRVPYEPPKDLQQPDVWVPYKKK